MGMADEGAGCRKKLYCTQAPQLRVLLLALQHCFTHLSLQLQVSGRTVRLNTALNKRNHQSMLWCGLYPSAARGSNQSELPFT